MSELFSVTCFGHRIDLLKGKHRQKTSRIRCVPVGFSPENQPIESRGHPAVFDLSSAKL